MDSNNVDAAKGCTNNHQSTPPTEPILVEARPECGFQYPYYLSVPEGFEDAEQRPILVEPHNVDGPIECFSEHLDLARQRIEGGSGRRIADELGSPFLIPVFPRPFEEPVDWTHLIHMLDAETMQIEDGPLARVDLQLLSMVDDARKRLADWGCTVDEDVMLNGFSSSGAFVNRFVALHPDRICSVSAGGTNGLLILPRTRAEVRVVGERALEYPVGVANVEELTGEPFDLEAFCAVDQFIYMGADDDKDALLYPDAWTDPELRASAILVYGEDIHEERFPHCQSVYEDVGVNAVFRVYENVGHTPKPAEPDIVEFHERSLADEDITSIPPEPGHRDCRGLE